MYSIVYIIVTFIRIVLHILYCEFVLQSRMVRTLSKIQRTARPLEVNTTRKRLGIAQRIEQKSTIESLAEEL